MTTGATSILYSSDGYEIAVSGGSANSANNRAIPIAGSDGSNNRLITLDTSGRTIAVGAGVAGAAVVGNPVRVAGSDGTNTRDLFMDSSGRVITVGAAASGAAVAGNPVLVGGSDGTNARTLRTATDGTLRIDPTGTTNQPVTVTSGTIVVTQSTAANLLATVTQGPANTLTNGWPVKVTDGTNTMPTGDAVGRAIFEKITDGTNTAGVDANNHLFVAGKSATGVAPTGNPLSVSGVDSSGLKRSFLTITNGAAKTVPDPWKTTVHNSATLTTSGNTVITGLGYSEWYLVINLKNAPTGTSPTIQFKVEEVDPIDQTTVFDIKATGVVHTSAGTESLNIHELDGDTVKISWTITGASASWTGVNVSFVGHAAGNSIEGQADVGTLAEDPPVPVAGVDVDGYIQYLNVDSLGQLKVVSQQAAGSISVTLSYDQSVAVAGAQAGFFFNALNYTVPANYSLNMAQFNSWSIDNRVTARVSKFISMGTWNVGTQVFTSGSAYTSPAFASYLEAEVTVVIGGTNNITLNASYTNQDGTAGRTATVTVPKNTPVGFKAIFTLQSGDYGVRSVQSISQVSTNTGTVVIKGGVEFYYQSMTTAGLNYITVPAASTQIVASGEVLELAWSSNAAATSERIIKVAGALQRS